jgi:prepilin-type N-terminal cleavage/methylation domain-containing protein
MKTSSTRRAFTLIELLVVVSIISLLLAILVPALGRARDAALITQSVANLNNLKSANMTYAADWADRHFTAMPDDVGSIQPTVPCTQPQRCAAYVSQIACPSQQLLGFDTNGGLWGYWVAGQLCPQSVGQCGNWAVLEPCDFVDPGSGGTGHPSIPYTDCFGAYQMCNTKAFNTYVNNRFYDKSFYAPKDTVGMTACEFGFENEGEYTPNPQDNQYLTFPTYIWSIANMWPPGVFSSKPSMQSHVGKPCQAGPGGFKSPSLGLAIAPELKVLMMEKLWLQNRGKAPLKNGNFATPRCWLFNEAYNSAPACLFIDGHTQVCAMNTAVNDDTRTAIQNAQESSIAPLAKGLWHKGTPCGPDGWFTAGAGYDPLIDLRPTSFGILTVDGIMGRDILKAGN